MKLQITKGPHKGESGDLIKGDPNCKKGRVTVDLNGEEVTVRAKHVVRVLDTSDNC